jgi:hypothetical protein
VFFPFRKLFLLSPLAQFAGLRGISSRSSLAADDNNSSNGAVALNRAIFPRRGCFLPFPKGMDTMRRLYAALAGLGLLTAVLGCHHTCGRCDCDIEGYGCCCGGAAYHTPGTIAAMPHDDAGPAPIATGGSVPAQMPVGNPAPAKPAEQVPAPKPKEE